MGKSIHEDFARFFERPTREDLRNLIKNNFGELPQCDFKADWPALPKLARHILGIANSKGGCVIVGVAQTEDNVLEPKGLSKLTDKAEITGGIKRYIPDALFPSIDVLDFSYSTSEYETLVGKKFQVILVDDDPKHLPFISTAESDDISNNAIYVRRGTSTEVANYQELQILLNRRLETGYSSSREIDLETHLEQLKILYRHIDEFHFSGATDLLDTNLGTMIRRLMGYTTKTPNPNYPKEGFDAFIARMVEKKKARIAIDLNVANI